MSTLRGNALPFRSRAAARNNNVPANATDSRANMPCRFFLVGSCLKGALCPFAHVEVMPTGIWPIPQIEEDESGPGAEDFSRTIAGAFVKFDDGGRIANIWLPNDVSAVHLSDLPPGSSPRSVQAFLAQHGFEVPESHIWMSHQADELPSANVQSDDPAFSKELCTLLQTSLAEGTSLAKATSVIRATPTAARMPSSHAAGRVDCKKVRVSWHKAVRPVWLNFWNYHIAVRVYEKFTAGAYKILGQKVVAASPSFSFSTKGASNRPCWSLALKDIPATVSSSGISRSISLSTDKPRHIEMGEPGYSIDEEQASAAVRSLLTNIGPVEYWETTLESTTKRAKATARFLDEDSAREAVSQLNDMKLPFHRNGKLTVQLVYSAKFKVRSDIYDAVLWRADDYVKTWRKIHVYFHAYPSTRILQVEGESGTEVACAKAILDDIVKGGVAKDGQEVLWDESLRRNGELWRSVRQLMKEHRVIIVRDKAKQELRLFGTKDACNEAEAQLAELFRKESYLARIIDLDVDQFRWACHEGFKNIVNKLGAEIAALYVTPSPMIVITGSQEDYDFALALVNSRKPGGQAKSKTASGAAVVQDCCICWTEADTPVRTTCGHVYCQDCFENSCASLSTNASDSGLLCHGNEGECSRVISLQDLHTHLSSALFEEFLEKSLMSMVRRSPNSFRFCPTPDCGYVYRVTEAARTHTCSKCLQPTCSACHEPHVNMTCADYKDIKSGGYAAFEKLKQEVGIKDCPKCKTPIEKTMGCNHVTCVACDAHICWVCSMSFPSSEPVYEHLTRMHSAENAWDEYEAYEDEERE